MNETTQTGPQRLVGLESEGHRTWRLHILSASIPAWAGRIVELPAGDTVLGRLPPAGCAIADPLMSRSHMRIRVRTPRDSVVVEDLGSRNGSWLNGRPLDKASAGHGAVVRLGSLVGILESDDGAALGYRKPSKGVPGRSAWARKTRRAVAEAASGRLPVLLTGPTGSGKEHVAAELHRRSGRSGPLVRMNITAVPAQLFESELFGHVRGAFSGAVGARGGRFEEADRGTLVLDEIGDLPPPLQPKLLRVLEESSVRPVGGTVDRPVDVRIIASTHVDLPAAVASGNFRADLYARLAGCSVELAPLGERRPDLLALCDAAAPSRQRDASWSARFTTDAVEGLALHRWPGNVRELRGALEYVSARCPVGTVDLADLPEAVLLGVRRAVATPTPPRGRAARPDAAQLRVALQIHEGSIGGVARAFHVDRRQVYRWLEYAGIDGDEIAALRDTATPE